MPSSLLSRTHVAVRVGDVERGAVALGTVAPPDLADGDAVPLQMCGQCREVESADAHREVVEVATFSRLRRGTGRHQIDHRGAGAQLHELGLFEPALDVAAQHLSVKPDRAIEISDPQHQVIEPGDTDRRRLICLRPFQIRCVRHFRLHSVTALILPRFGRGGRQIIAVAAQPVAPRHRAGVGCARPAARRDRGRRRGRCPFDRIARPPARRLVPRRDECIARG